jgi:hypothetical protein
MKEKRSTKLIVKSLINYKINNQANLTLAPSYVLNFVLNMS